MGWVDPRTWATGGTVTASQLNVDVRDNMNYLYGIAPYPNIDVPVTFDPRYDQTARAVTSSNTCHYNRVFGAGDVSALRIYVAVSSGNIGAAIYNTTGSGVTAEPDARQATSGAVACPAVGVADVSLGSTVAVSSCSYWFALSANNTTATVNASGTIASGWHNGVNAVEATAHPPPATANHAAAASRLYLMVGV